MALPVSLKAVIAEMDTFGEEFRPYLNQHTGELATISLEEIHAVEQDDALDDLPDWQQAMIQKAAEILSSAEYLPLPGKFEIHEYTIMERFCLTLEDNKLGHELWRQMHGTRAFQRFKDTLRRYNRLESWYAFRQAAMAGIATQWLKAHHISYTWDI